jgi:hypothetical protein
MIAGLVGSSSSFAFQASVEFRNAQKAQVDSMTPASVLTKLKQTGWGSCYVSVGVQGTTYCKNYFVSSKPPYTGNYRGYPAHQKANSNLPRYSSYSRIKPAGTDNVPQQASSGCFSGAGGAWSGSVCWLGNEPSECALGEAEYAVAMLKSAIDDPEDPCSIYEVQQNSSGSEGTTALITGGKIKRDSQGNCYQQIIGPSGSAAFFKVADSNSPVCKYFKRRAKFELTAKVLPLLGSATVLTQSNYQAQLIADASTKITTISSSLSNTETLSQYPLFEGTHTFQDCVDLTQGNVNASIVKAASPPVSLNLSNLSTTPLSGTMYCSLTGSGAACPTGWNVAGTDTKYGGNTPCGTVGACCY